MTPSFYKVLETDGGFLAIMPRPRPGEWLHDDLIGLREFGVNCIVSLLEKAEEADLILSHEQDLVEKLEMEFVSYPIRDRTVPLELSSFITLVHGIVARVRNGQGVAVHCLGGIGRSGVTVASAMVALGADVETIFQHISQARGIDVPDTDEQAAWFEEHHPSFRLDV